MVSLQAAAFAEPQVLVTVGPLQVTSADLNAAMASSPFGAKVPTMDENDQAGLRGDMLRRLVISRLLTLEAQRLGLDKTEAYRQDLESFRLGLLYQAYVRKLRDGIVIPDATLAAMTQQFKQDNEGLAAAKSAYINERYRTLKETTFRNLVQQAGVRTYEERFAGAKPDTVLAEGGDIRVRYGDLVNAKEYPKPPSSDWLKDRLASRVELLVVADAAAKQGIDVAGGLQKYGSERLPAVMMETKTKEWIPDEKTLRDWFAKHPATALVPERRHIGQLVLATREEADAMRRRIAKGESLFVLAGKYSVDAEGRKQNGDMGWVVKGKGLPALEQALAKLKDGEVSDVVKAPDGTYHLLTILERKPERHEAFADVRDRVAQAIIAEKLQVFVADLDGRYKPSWKVLQPAAPAAK
ncbi:MAG TPA: peptidyl-prolyl cis-trans isomerase [Rhodocyclaceae bacterium]|nr:peptidyl-prolyl cis-trans isomerase [Rhodocyclaceae bacterium]